MKNNKLKAIIFGLTVITVCILTVACKDGPGEETQQMFDDEFFQVYRDLFEPSGIITPVPSYNSYEIEAVPLKMEINGLFTEGWSLGLVGAGGYPWTVSGNVADGKMNIALAGKQVLDIRYDNNFTKGVRIAYIDVNTTPDQRRSFYLAKYPNDPKYHNFFVSVYYASANYNDGIIKLKAGWNFVETYKENHYDEKYKYIGETKKIGFVTQNIYDVYKAGYRWFYYIIP